MPAFDYPYEQLLTYKGSSPKPEDFDAYWAKALSNLEHIPFDIEKTPATFQCSFANCYDVYFTGEKGARIYAKLLVPKALKPRNPAMLRFHGYTGHSGNWTEMLPYAAAGFIVAAMDCRGQGGLSQDVGGHTGNTHNGHFIRGLQGNPEDMLMRSIYLDTVQLARLILSMDEVDSKQVYVSGGSQGGALALACAALEPRISRAGVWHPFLSDFKRVWEMDLAKDAYVELRTYFRLFDPLHEREDEFYQKLGYLDIVNHVPNIKADVLFGIGLMDEICPPSTQFAAFNSLTTTKQKVVYPDFNHEFLPGMEDKVFQFLTKES